MDTDSRTDTETPAIPRGGHVVGTIDITPTWQGIMPVLIAALENGTDEGKRLARDELMRLAKFVDATNSGE